jgi:hypothetical protein
MISNNISKRLIKTVACVPRVIMLVLCEEDRTHDGSVTVHDGISPVIFQASYVYKKGTGHSCGMLRLFLDMYHILSP